MEKTVKLERDFSNTFFAKRLYVYLDTAIVGNFPDTETGMELARKCYNDVLEVIRKTGQTGETLLKEVVSIPEKKEGEA